MKINDSGQVTIPKELRDLFGLTPGTALEIEISKNGLLIKPERSQSDDLIKWLKEEHGDEMATLTSQDILHMMH